MPSFDVPLELTLSEDERQGLIAESAEHRKKIDAAQKAGDHKAAAKHQASLTAAQRRLSLSARVRQCHGKIRAAGVHNQPDHVERHYNTLVDLLVSLHTAKEPKRRRRHSS